ncbi:ParA family protein [Sulfolobus tengchongensis]|uniref:ParA family protein n=1 Tax=Sulfolobus tengchongensis TaxID=207809 RepID=A0AAX4KYU9_9CREN
MKLRVGFIGIKGGVGKTTLALNTAFYLSNKKYKVLYIDKDFLSMGSLILGFNGKGFHKAITDDLGKEEYEYKVNDNLTIFKFYSDPVNEEILQERAKTKSDKLIKAYLDVISKGYDVIIVDYGRIFKTNDPLVYTEFDLFRKHFHDYLIGGVGITNALIEDVIKDVRYYIDLRMRINFKPLAFVINMVPQIGDIQREINEEIKKIRDILNCEVVTIPFKQEFLQYNNLGRHEDLIQVGKIIERYINQT